MNGNTERVTEQNEEEQTLASKKTEERRRAARGCPSVWLPMTPKQRTKFFADTKGWVPDWGHRDEDWVWLETLLDTERWSNAIQKDVRKKANRGMGYALDQLTGATTGMTDKSRCQWTRMRNTCHNEAPLQWRKVTESIVLNTLASSVAEQMEAMRRGDWLDNAAVQKEADILFENNRIKLLEE